MAVDFEAIRRKLNQLSGQGNKRNVMWRPQEGEDVTVRLLSFPNNDDGLPFAERWFYYNIGNNPGLLAPYQFGKPDPIQDLINKLRDEGTKESYELAKKLYPNVPDLDFKIALCSLKLGKKNEMDFYIEHVRKNINLLSQSGVKYNQFNPQDCSNDSRNYNDNICQEDEESN